MEPWKYFWKFVLCILLVSEHAGSRVIFTSPEAPGGTQDLTDSSYPDSESSDSMEPETRLPSGGVSPMAAMKLVSEVRTSAAILADSYEMLSGQLHSLPVESSTPNAEGPSEETTVFDTTNVPDDISGTTDNLSFAEANSAPPGAPSNAPNPLSSQDYTHSIRKHGIHTRKSSSGFRPPGTSMVKKGSISAYLLSPQGPTGQRSQPAARKLVSEVSTSAAILADSSEMLSGQLHTLPPNAEGPSQETTFFQATNAPDDISGTTDILSLERTEQMLNMDTTELVSTSAAIVADSYEMLSGQQHSLPLENSTPNAEGPSEETTFFQATNAPDDISGTTDILSLESTEQMSNMDTTELVSKSAAILADTYEMLSGQQHSLPLENSTPNAENSNQETTFFQDTSE
ncbi:uncharacterized protein [Erythrolamprus reginae]|uniref:uncharacterized protein n=1 Tax=Erythrolamprus reginae TaxID=121349 RepID=UPI00396CD815